MPWSTVSNAVERSRKIIDDGSEVTTVNRGEVVGQHAKYGLLRRVENRTTTRITLGNRRIRALEN
jgi:hypothetical protein